MISFSGVTAPYTPPFPRQFKKWLNEVIKKEDHIPGDIYYIFCDDEYLYRINKKYLKHDTLTDIITFPTSTKDNIISGEIYISVERVRENAKERNVSFQKELSRVMVHGILHLLGYDDQSESQKSHMREKEDYYLSLLPQKNF